MGQFDFEERFEDAKCDIHGDYQQKIVNFGKRDHRAGCPKCNEIAEAERKERDRRERHEMHVQNAMNDCGIPALYLKSQFTRESPEIARGWMRKVLDRASTGPLVIVGDVGTGKTYLSCAMAIEAIRAGYYAKYVSALVYCRKIRDTWGRNADPREDQILDSYAKSGFLVIDELGAGKAADEPIIQELVCARYDADMMHRTIIVTNVAVKNLGERIGERAADRIKDGGTLLTMTGASRRSPAA